MSSLAILFIVITTIIIPKNVVGSIAVQDIDVNKLIDLVNQNRINNQDSDSYDSDDSDDSDSSEELPLTGRVGADNLMDIISLAVNNKNAQDNNDHKIRTLNHVNRAQKYGKRNKKSENSSEQTITVAKLLKQLLNQGGNDVELKYQPDTKRPKKRILPNRLLGDVKVKNPDDLDEYSKIYILLNPEALQKSKSSKSSINKMISKLLSLSPSSSKRDQLSKSKQRGNKGFVLKSGVERRRGRDSREMYAPKDSMEDKPKRNRNSNSGHTAIPYIRHRGENIYEKDN